MAVGYGILRPCVTHRWVGVFTFYAHLRIYPSPCVYVRACACVRCVGRYPLPPACKRSSGSFSSYEELVDGFTEILTSRRVSEQMRVLMNDLVVEIISSWREEFCRLISLKLNSYFMQPFCDELPRC